MKQTVVVLDLEGVLTPEIWISVAEKTASPNSAAPPRDEPDYEKLMRGRIEILDRHHLKLSHIQEVIAAMPLLPGAPRLPAPIARPHPGHHLVRHL